VVNQNMLATNPSNEAHVEQEKMPDISRQTPEKRQKELNETKVL
jgi:hypothetical protein